jgi:hypothetical protein
MSIIFSHNLLSHCVIFEDGNIIKGIGDLSNVVYGQDICDLPVLKRHTLAFFGQIRRLFRFNGAYFIKIF